MLGIVEQWWGSDRGRQRKGNEDNFLVRSPLFVVADGMGGAQAGEVAAEMAVRRFEEGLPDSDIKKGLVTAIQAANEEIYSLSRRRRQHAGMGTTLTAAFVRGDDVVVAHVGDSRAYALRDGELKRLTTDHSLVGELVARGKLTEEEAETHPQRSVITRALGPEPTVAVDVNSVQTQAGDLFLLCSDGLTSMVSDERVAEVVSAFDSLDDAGEALIDAANAAGGRDNITVLLFRIGEVAPAASTGDSEETTKLVAPARGVGGPLPIGRQERRVGMPRAVRVRRNNGDARGQTPTGRAAARAGGVGQHRKPSRLRAALKSLVITVCVLAPVVVGVWIATRAIYFVGTDPKNQQTVTIYRGLPYELPAGIKLYERFSGSGVTLEQVPSNRRRTFTDHKLRSRKDAEDLMRALELGELE